MNLFAEYEPGRKSSDRPADLVLRGASAADVESIAQLASEREGESPARHADAARRELADDSTRNLLCVAEVDGQCVAFARARRVDPEAPTKARNIPRGWYLAGVVVHAQHRRRGIGLALTQYRLEWIRERGGGPVYYFVNAMNRASIDLHAKLGFVEHTRDFAFAGVTFRGGLGVLFELVSP